MAALDVGRVCMKIAGREAGKYCVVLKKMDANFVLVTGPRVLTQVKRRRCNIEHLEPTPYNIKISAEASDDIVIGAYEKAGILTKLGLRKPSPEIVKEAKKVKKVEKEKPKPEKPVEKKEEEKPKKKEEPKKEEKPKEKKEEKKPLSIKFKIPSIRRGKKKEKKPEKKPEKKAKKKPEKKAKKAAKKTKKKKK